MRALVAALAVCCCSTWAFAQPRPEATLRVTVVDPSGAVIVGAQVTVKSSAPSTQVPPVAPVTDVTGGRGDAVFAALDPGRYSMHVESPGFEPYDASDVRVRAGDNRREVKLKIAKLAETVQVGRDPRERASDPRSDAFATLLSQAQIEELPDDPDEMEQVLKDMAGPGAVMRVNGFRGGRLPPKDQIQQIRFRRNMFAADVHEPGFISVDITTKPGLENWRGTTSLGFRDDALNSRNAFATARGDERNERLGFSLSGPLWRKHTSLSLSVDGTNAFDTKTIVAATPSGYFADSIRKPNDALNVSARIEHGLTKSQMLRVEAQRNHGFSDNLGVGDFDLAERGYHQTRNEDVLRASLGGTVRKTLYNEARVQWRSQDISLGSISQAPAVLVLNAFNSGGAQVNGGRRTNEIEVADDLDIATSRHALRTGILFEGGRYSTNERRNDGGTFTFADLNAFNAALPTTYTRNVGNPDVAVSQVQIGTYVQDDFRATKNLTLSGGVRHEYQSHVGGFHLGPRGGLAWSPFKSGKTTIRAGAGIFFDWFDAQPYQQTVQLDGTHQHIETIVQPGYPDPLAGGRALLLPNGRVQLAGDLAQPQLREAIVGVEQQIGQSMRLNTMLIRRRGSNMLRGVNVNAPQAGVRPDPTAGTITRIESTASSSFDGLSVNLNFMKPEKRIFVAANYMLSCNINETDSAFGLAANAGDLGAERGPALMDARHRAMGFANVPLYKKLSLGTSFRIQSALPYNITTGRDDNGDTISNDRPAGVTRNTGRGSMLVDISARLSWRLAFGTRPAGGTMGGPQVRIVRGGADSNPLAETGGMGDPNKRFSFEVYAQAFNALNHVNAVNFSGVLASPFFGRATSAAAPRRVEVGTRLSF